MNKLLLALALAIAFTASASAAPARGEHATEHHQGRGAYMQQPQSKSRAAKGETTDPYWTPCDYSNGWKIDACGGS